MVTVYLLPQKYVTCPSHSSPPALWMQTESGCWQCWASPNWLLVRSFRSRQPPSRSWMGLPSSPSSSLCSHFLTTENWGTWFCSWGQPRSRGPKSSGCNISWTQSSLCCTQPWRRSAGLPRWSRCSGSKLHLWSF